MGPPSRTIRGAVAVAALLAIGATMAAQAPAASPVTIKLGGSCSLTQAIAFADGAANSCSTTAPSGDTTIIAPAGLWITTGLLHIQASETVTVQGAGQAVTTIEGTGSSPAAV